MSKFKVMSVVCVAIAAMLMCAVAEAQPGRGGGGRGGRGGFMGGGPGGFMGGGGNMLMLLGNEQVQNELEFSFEQKEKLGALRDEIREAMGEIFGGMRDLSPEERRERMTGVREKMQEQMAEMQKKAEKILDKDQLKRVKQISIQVQGYQALGNEDVLKELKITDAQKKKLEKIDEDLQAERTKLSEGMRDVPQAERREMFAGLREKMEKMNADTQKKVMAVLTSTQKKKLEEMKGKAFELDRSRGFGGRGGQQGGRGGQQGGRGGGRGGRGGGAPAGGDDGPIR